MARRKQHPGSIDERGGSLRLRLCVGGKYYAYSFPWASREEVEEFARREHKRLTGWERTGMPIGVRFSDLVERFRADVLPTLAPNTQTSYPKSLKPLLAFFVGELDDPCLHALRGADFERYLTWRRMHGPSGKPRKRPLSNRTLERDRAIAHRMFHKAMKWGLIDRNPVAATDKPKVEGRDPVLLTAEQMGRLLEECGDRPMLHTYVTLLAESGARCESEALWVRWEDVDLEGGFLWIDSGRDGHRTKTGKGRWVPLTSELRQTLRDHFARFRFAQYGTPPTPSPWVFHHQRERRNREAGSRVSSYRAAFNSACRRAALPPGFRAHDLRHRRATTWLADGGDVVKVKEALGHASLATTMGYTHLAREHLRDLPGVLPERGSERERA